MSSSASKYNMWKVLITIAVSVAIFVGIVSLALYMKSTQKTSGSAIYFSGDNVAQPLEVYDNAANKEYATVIGMTRKRMLNEINARHSQMVKQKYPEVMTELDRLDLIRPEANAAEIIKAKEQDKPAQVVIPAPSAAIQPGVDIKKLNCPAMLKMYLSGPLDAEAQNKDVIPMYELYRM